MAGNDSAVIVDFGPSNTLFDHGVTDTVAVLDWEFCHLGEPIEDLAWCKWIVRAHHPDVIACSRGDGWYPLWARRVSQTTSWREHG